MKKALFVAAAALPLVFPAFARDMPSAVVKAADELGTLAHGTAVAYRQEASDGVVDAVSDYDDAMNGALSLNDPVAQTTAIAEARQDLADATHTRLTPALVAKIDGTLGITGAPASLGTSP